MDNLHSSIRPTKMAISKLLLLFICSWWSFDVSQSAPAVQSTLQAMSYLTQFGYIEPSSSRMHSSLLSEEYLTNAIKEFQRFAGLNQTGNIDNETMVMMNTPRCGVKDKVGKGSSARRKRYALQGSRWRTRDLTYRISKYPTNLKKSEVDDEVRKSFQVWSDQTDLTFTASTSGRIHIDVRFERGEHGDGDPFDGPGGTLAHAYFPIYGGDAHFDADERWSIRSYKGTNLFQVAAHEFGHSLGLSHSDIKASLMAPFYRNYEPNFHLHKDDILAIQALYGTKSTKERPYSKPTVGDGPIAIPPKGGEHEEGELCSDSSIDTIFQVDGKTYAFKGEYYWKLTDVGLADGYPRVISNDWSGLPSNIDAAFSWRNGKTYFFKGDKYYRFTDKKMDDTYPQRIEDGFPGIPNNLDAALVWSGNGKIYFFKDSSYWRFDPEQNLPVSSDYPKSISHWDGIPNKISAAFQWTNGYTYFFKGTYYWRFNDRTFAVDTARPPFPRASGIWWFGCKSMTADDDPQPGSIPSSSTKKSHADIISTDSHYAANAKDEVELYQPESQFLESQESNGGHITHYSLSTLGSTFLAMVASFFLLRE